SNSRIYSVIEIIRAFRSKLQYILSRSSTDETSSPETSNKGNKNIDYYEIPGNIIKNPYFTYDELIQYPYLEKPGQDGIPDYWGVYYENRWWTRNPVTHEKKWLTDETIPDPKHKHCVLWHPKTFPFDPEDRFDGIYQEVKEGIITNRWYRFECTYKADNIMPIFTPQGLIDDNYWGSDCYIGCVVYIYHPTRNGKEYHEQTILVNGPQGDKWNETIGVYSSWKPGTTNGWITKERYVYVPENTTKLIFKIINYGIANLYVAKVSFTLLEEKHTPGAPSFKKEGEIPIVNFNGEDLFSIGFWGVPSRGGRTITAQELKNAGVNTVIHFSGLHMANPNYYYYMDLNELAQYGIYGMHSDYFGGYRLLEESNHKIFQNTPQLESLLNNRITRFSTYTKHKNFLGVQDDEPDSHPLGSGYLPDLREIKWHGEQFKKMFQTSQNTPLRYINLGYARGVYTSDNESDLRRYLSQADILSFTQNFPLYGKAYTGEYSCYSLEEIGVVTRYLLKESEKANGKATPVWALPAGWTGYAHPEWLDNKGNIRTDLWRFQVYNQIVNGASGVIWFGMLDVNLNYHYHLTNYLTITKINKELNQLLEVLKQRYYYDLWDSSVYLEGMLKKLDNNIYLIATNPSDDTLLNVTITLKNQIKIKSVSALFENNNGGYDINETREINQGINAFIDTFKPYDVHIYKIEIHSIMTRTP
ncbi:MAG: hypothetical protein QXS02_02775, partial [Candidatus Thermoplasmatota archaeon]